MKYLTLLFLFTISSTFSQNKDLEVKITSARILEGNKTILLINGTYTNKTQDTIVVINNFNTSANYDTSFYTNGFPEKIFSINVSECAAKPKINKIKNDDEINEVLTEWTESEYDYIEGAGNDPNYNGYIISNKNHTKKIPPLEVLTFSFDKRFMYDICKGSKIQIIYNTSEFSKTRESREVNELKDFYEFELEYIIKVQNELKKEKNKSFYSETVSRILSRRKKNTKVSIKDLEYYGNGLKTITPIQAYSNIFEIL